MKLGDQVCSYEQAEKLSNLGVKKPSHFYHNGLEMRVCFTGIYQDQSGQASFNAYTVAELMEMLPKDGSVSEVRIYSSGNCLYMSEHDDGFETPIFKGSIVAHAMADCLIWLIENNHIKASDL